MFPIAPTAAACNSRPIVHPLISADESRSIHLQFVVENPNVTTVACIPTVTQSVVAAYVTGSKVVSPDMNNNQTSTGWASGTERVPVVLVVDDHDDTRDLLRLVFEGHGYLVIEATDGEGAVAMALQERPDVIVMDTCLQRIDGLEATRRIRRIPALSGLPIVFLSGRVRPQDRIEAIACGANDYLMKPVGLEELERSIRKQIWAVNRRSKEIR